MTHPQHRIQLTPRWFIRAGLAVLFGLSALAASVRAQAPKPDKIEPIVRGQERLERLQKAEDERVKRLVQDAVAQAKETVALATDLESKTRALVERVNALLTNDEGKRLASDTVTSFSYMDMSNHPFISIERVKAKRSAAQSILDSLQKELQNPPVGYTPSPALSQELGGIASWSRERLVWVTEQQTWLDSRLAAAPKDLDLKSARTLKQVIDDYKADRIQAWRRAWAKTQVETREKEEKMMVEKSRVAAIEEAAAEAERRLREAEARIATMKAEFEAKLKEMEEKNARLLATAEQKYKDAMAEIENQRKLAEAQRQAKSVEATIAAGKVVSEAEKKRLIERCKEPEVQEMLAPFLTEGYWQPGEKKNESVDKTPMSFSKLQAAGALQPSSEGLQKLLWVCTNRSGWGKNDTVRPRWPYSLFLNQLKPDQLEHVKKVQDCLRELGPTLVEQHMLAP